TVTTTANVTLTAADSISGGIGGGVLSCIVSALFALAPGGDGDITTALTDNAGTHCSRASVTIDGGTVSGAVINISATSTATPANFTALVPRSHADVIVQNGGSVSGTGNVTLKATSTVTVD